jgi:LysM repeat protein
MMRQMMWKGLLLLALLLLIRPGETAVAQDPQSQILALVNQVRASYGQHPYEYNAALAVAAQNHANWMASTATYSHTGAGGSTPQSRATAAGYQGYATENIVGGTGLTPRQGVIWWQNSAVHLNSMTSGRYIHVGIGFAQGHGQNFYVMVMGTPSDAPVRPSSGQGQQSQPLIVTPIEISQPGADGSIIHTVRPGQTAWAIAARYEIELVDLLRLNGLNETAVLQPGDEIIIQLAEGVPTPAPPTTHTVRRGQTAWEIALLHNIPLAELYWLNNLNDESILQPGQELKVRLAPGEAPPATPTPRVSYSVRTGDTLWSIAIQHRLSLEQLLAFNNLSPEALLQVGQELLVVAPTPVPTTTPLPSTATMTPTAVLTPTTTPADPNLSQAALAAAELDGETAVTPTATTNPSLVNNANPRSWNDLLATGTIVLSLGLALLAGAAVIAAMRET